MPPDERAVALGNISLILETGREVTSRKGRKPLWVAVGNASIQDLKLTGVELIEPLNKQGRQLVALVVNKELGKIKAFPLREVPGSATTSTYTVDWEGRLKRAVKSTIRRKIVW